MSTHDEAEEAVDMDPELLAHIRGTYHVPGETPVDAIWAAVQERIGKGAGRAAAHGAHASGAATTEASPIGPAGAGVVVDLADERRRREADRRSGQRPRWAGWAVAAAATLVLGIGIGRMTVPTSSAPAPGTSPAPAPRTTDAAPGDGAAMALAEREYLGETESLLTMVRADGRVGRLDPAMAQWAGGLLSQTRLLLDVQGRRDPAIEELLLDLELVLVQITAVAGGDDMDAGRAQTELELAIKGLDEGEVLSRIRAVTPPDLAGI